MVIARIGVPQIALLTVPPPAKGKDGDHPLFPQASGDPAEHILDRMDRTAEAETSDNGLDGPQEEEQLVAQLQLYFQKHTRYPAAASPRAIVAWQQYRQCLLLALKSCLKSVLAETS